MIIKETAFTIFFLVIGIFEIVSNLYHLTRGSVEKAGRSAAKQHQELPADLPVSHYFVKALLMLITGILFSIIGGICLVQKTYYFIPACFGLAAMSGYGIVEAIIYKRPVKVWISSIVYSIPLIIHLIVFQ